MNKKSGVILIIIFFALLAGAGVWKWKNKTQNITEPKEQVQNELENLATEKEPLVLEEIDTSNWKTYRNEEYGFEVKYPEGWELDTYIDDKKNLEIYLGEKGKTYNLEGSMKRAIYVSFAKNKINENLSQKELFDKWKEFYNIYIWKINVGTMPAYYYKGFGEGLDISQKDFDFSITSPMSLEQSGYPEVRLILHGMIQSLRFTN